MRHLFMAAALALLAGCSHYLPHVQGVAGTSPEPAVPWTPPSREPKPLVLPAEAVPLTEVTAAGHDLTLARAVDIALRNNPDTRTSWANARAAAAGYGAVRSSFLPALSLEGAAMRSQQESEPVKAADYAAATLYNGAVNLSWLIFDFGGRAAAVDESRQALLAASWTHNAVIQRTVLGTEIAYYGCAGARAMLEAHQASLANAQQHLKAAEEKRGVGLATSADVLQARTAWSQALLDVQNAEGDLRISRGALALAMGFRAGSACDLQVEIPEIPPDTLAQQVGMLIGQALATRPDLQANRSRARAAQANLRQSRAALLPSISAAAGAERTWWHDADGHMDNYSGALRLQMPLFAGFSRQYQVARAQAEADAAKEAVRAAEQEVSFQVFASHSDFLTAQARVVTAADLLASATQSEQVALGRYKEGVGSILDLLTAQRALALARAQQINARLAWHIALAQLAHDVGLLGVDGRNPLTPAPIQPR